jgi:hypothetical protein
MTFKILPLYLVSTKQLAQYHKEFWVMIHLILSAVYPIGLLLNTGPENDKTETYIQANTVTQ